MPDMNYNALRGRMKECGMTQKECAARIGISEGQLCHKLAGAYDFKQDEIHGLCQLLQINPADIGRYFFCPKS